MAVNVPLPGSLMTLLQDVRFALRQMRKAPGFAATAVLTLALGIGATVGIFSIVEGVLLRPLPFPEPGRLVTLGDELEGAGVDALPAPAVAAPEMTIYERETRRLLRLGGYQTTSYEVSGADTPALVNAARLTGNMFAVLGTPALLGRVFGATEDADRQPVVVLSYPTWQERFHGDSAIVGRKVLLDRKPYTVIGVMPPAFEFPLVPGHVNRSEFWVPMSLSPGEMANSASWNFQMVGRLRPGATLAQVEAQARITAQEIMRSYPPAMASLRLRPVLEPLGESTVKQARPLIRTLFLAVTVVLFIACANLAGLLLVRVIRRQREMAVRLALGASGAAVIRQTLLETLALSIAGGVLGLTLAWAALRVGVRLLPETLPRVSSIGLDGMVIAFALALAIITALACGLLPALAAARTGVNSTLKEGGRTGSSGRHTRLRSALVIAELAVALVLLTAAGLLLRSFEKLRAVDLGFQTDHILTAAYSLPRQQYKSQAAIDGFNRELLRKLAQAPVVEAASLSALLPAASQDNTSTFVVEGNVPRKGAGLNLAWSSQVMGPYFRTVRIPLLHGREFTEADGADAPLVLVVNHSLAQHYWPGQNPVGKRLHWGLPETPLPWMTVVGEIGDIKQSSADTATRDQIYQPAGQQKASYGRLAPPEMLNGANGYVVLRARLSSQQMADVLRRTVRSLDPQLPLTQVESMAQVVDEGQAPRRFYATLIAGFAAAAALLAMLGIYSVIAFSAALRKREMAIRLAVGSPRQRVVRLILVSGAQLALLGCAIGGVGAVFATRLLRSLLFQVDPLDPLVLTGAVVSIFVMGLLASVVPAQRAASVKLLEVLHSE